MQLSRRRRKFATEYIKNGFNGVQAVFAAGYRQGYDSACVEASRLLRNAKVQQIIERHLQMSKLSADEVIERLTEVANAEVSEIKASDKLKALELLGKFHKLFTDKVDHSFQLDSALTRLRSEFPDVAEPELKSWLADILGITQNIEEKGTIG